MSQVYCLKGLSELQTQKLTFALLCIMLFFLWQILLDKEKNYQWALQPSCSSPQKSVIVSCTSQPCSFIPWTFASCGAKSCACSSDEVLLSGEIFCFKNCIFHGGRVIISQEKYLFQQNVAFGRLRRFVFFKFVKQRHIINKVLIIRNC